MNTELTLDVGHASTPRSLHEILAAALCFPGWHGMNWDAFWDSAIDSSVTFPRRVTLLNFNVLEKRLPEEAQMFRDAMEDLAKRMPISVVAVDDLRNVVGHWGQGPIGVPDVG